MAEKRMFSLSVVDTDWFLDLPLTTQALYFHFGMRADDDGFVDSPKSIMRKIGCSNNDYQLLVAKRYILEFDSGVIVIKHWRMNNAIRGDRYKETQFKEELSTLEMKENKSYTEKKIFGLPNDNQMDTNGIPSNISISKTIFISNNNIEEKENKQKKKNEIYFENNKLNDLFIEFLQLRKKLKAVNSDRAIKMLINELNKYDDDIKYKMIENSILNSWKSIYPLKENTNYNKNNSMYKDGILQVGIDNSDSDDVF